MGPLHAAASKAMGQRPPRGEDATIKVANILNTAVTGRRVRYSNRKMAGNLVHFAVGFGIGAVYGLLADEFPSITAGRGTAMGTAVYGSAHAIAAPALGLAPSPAKNGPTQESVELAAHLVYGVVTETVRRLLAD
jgi:putative membrane protein